MTTKQKWALGITLVAIVAIWYFWNDISKLWSKTPKEGDACLDSNGATSVIENGVCKEIVRPGPETTDTQRAKKKCSRVNPNGTIEFYDCPTYQNQDR